jgi:hypothetical protein
MILYKYLILIIIIIAIFIVVSHYIDYNRINNEINIQQSEHPLPDIIDAMIEKRHPSLFRYELELWDGFDLLIGQSYEDIIEVLKDNKVLEYNCQKIYLKPFELPLTKKWDIKCHKTSKSWNELGQEPITETAYMHLLACFSGMATICLISPKHKKDIKKHKNFKDELVANPDKYDHITIPIRPCNMIYVPFGWHYYIYSGVENEYCVLLDMKCITYFN